MRSNRAMYDVAALLARCGVGAVFLTHGWQKIQVGVTATGRSFDAAGVPLPTAAAVYATFAELLAGAALVIGVALPIAGALLFLDMLGALVFVHARHGMLLVDGTVVRNGIELVLVLGLASLLFAAGGGGRLTLDHRIFGPGRRDRAEVRPEDLPFLPPEDAPTAPPGGPDAPPTPPGGPHAFATTRPDITVPGTTAPRAAGPGAALPPDASGSAGQAAPPADDTVRARPAGARGSAGTERDVPVAGTKTGPPAERTTQGRTRRSTPRKTT